MCPLRLPSPFLGLLLLLGVLLGGAPAEAVSAYQECSTDCRTSRTQCLDACRIPRTGDAATDAAIKGAEEACRIACKEAYGICQGGCKNLPGNEKGVGKGPSVTDAPPPPPPAEEPAVTQVEVAPAPTVEAPEADSTPSSSWTDEEAGMAGLGAMALGTCCCGSGVIAAALGIVWMMRRGKKSTPPPSYGGPPPPPPSFGGTPSSQG